MAKTFIKSFLCIQILLSPAYAPALAQTGAANGAAEIAFADAIGDSLLRSYSVDELLRFKNFYESERSQLEKERQLLREKGIRDLEGFLRNHPESSVLDKVIFRLAELYYEQAENDYLAAQEDYGRALELHDAGELQQLPPEPQKDFSSALELYHQIVDGFPRSSLLDDAHYGIAFIAEDMQDQQAAVELYESFLKEFPDSRYTPEALMRLAEYYFNPPKNEIDRAIEIYKKVLDYTDSPKFNEALYKLGWSYYRINEYAKAISYFTMLADDISRAADLDPESKVSNPALREESIEYIGISFLDYTGVQGAEAYLEEIGGRPYGLDILRKIGDAYMNVKEEYDSAIYAYELLLKLYPFAEEAPLVQAKIAEAHRFLEDDQQTYLTRNELFAKYHVGTEWWEATTSKDARAKALELSEHALRANINLLLETAMETGNVNLYAQAVDDTRDYLKVFPDDSNAVLLHWNMALTLDAKLNQPDAAFGEYIQISNLYWGSKFQQEAAKNAIAIAQEMVQIDSLQRPEVLPLNIGDMREQLEKNAANLRRSLSFEPIPLSAGEQKLIEAIDNYLKLYPLEPESPARLSQAGSLCYNKNDFINSLKYYKTLLKHFPDDTLAHEAEYLVMESYFGNLDFRSVEVVAKRLLSKDASAEVKGKASQRLAEAIFLQAQSYAEASEHFKAAEEYSRVAEEVPDAEFADLALFNAGLEYDNAREYSRAVEIYGKLTTRYTESRHYLPSLNNLALDYRELRDYRNAAIIFERLAEEDSSSANIETHLYNASVSYVDAEDWNRAIRVNKKFVDNFPQSDDADNMLYNIASYHLKLNEIVQANEIYGEFAQKFPDSPRVVETHFRRGEYFLRNDSLDIAKQEFEHAVEKSKILAEAGTDGHDYFAAEALFQLTELKRKEFDTIAFLLPEENLLAAKARKKNMLIELVESYSDVASYATIRLYESTYKIGLMYESFADSWAQQEIPANNEEMRIVAKKEVNETAAELYERAASAYKNSLDVLSRIAMQYEHSIVETAQTDTAAYGKKVTIADSTLFVANRWIERCKEKISEVTFKIAEINLSTVRELLAAPVPESMDAPTRMEFRNQLLSRYISSLVQTIVAAHVRNLTEARAFGLENRWVERSRKSIVTTNQLLAAEYEILAWDALRSYAEKIDDYRAILAEDELSALHVADEMASLIEFEHNYSIAALHAYDSTITRAKHESIDNRALRQVENDFLKFTHSFAMYSDSLARIANKARREFESRFRTTQNSIYEDGLFTFEDNYLSLSDHTRALLKLGYEASQRLEIKNEYADKILLALVKSDPGTYAGKLGLRVEQTQVVTDRSWHGSAVPASGWTRIAFDDSSWQAPIVIDSLAAFGAYGAKRLWLNQQSTEGPIADSTRTDSLQVAAHDTLTAKTAQRIFLRKTIDVDGLPVAGQIQIRADGAYKLYINDAFISEMRDSTIQTHIHEFVDFLVAGKNVVALEILDADTLPGGVEALIFIKHIPGWQKRQEDIAAQKALESENLLFDKAIIEKK